MVADIGSCGIGEGRRITGVPDLLNHRLHRKIGEIGSISVCKNRLIDGLVPSLSGIPCICYIDRNTLRVTPNRPPAWPMLMTISGRSSSIFHGPSQWIY